MSNESHLLYKCRKCSITFKKRRDDTRRTRYNFCMLANNKPQTGFKDDELYLTTFHLCEIDQKGSMGIADLIGLED